LRRPHDDWLPVSKVPDAGPRVNLSLAIYAVEVAGLLFGGMLLRSCVTQAALWTGEMDGYLGPGAHLPNMDPESVGFQALLCMRPRWPT
jgi:hypothetical protein